MFARRYTAAKFDTVTRKARVSQDWVAATLAPFMPQPGSVMAKIHSREDQRMEKSMASAPMPTAVGAFKNHPLYALQRHLLKFEAIYPPDAPTLGESTICKTELLFLAVVEKQLPLCKNKIMLCIICRFHPRRGRLRTRVRPHTSI